MEKEELKKALKELGITGIVTTELHDKWTLDVYVNNEWFGLWDTTKNTFVE
jgi:hypothetical protein